MNCAMRIKQQKDRPKQNEHDIEAGVSRRYRVELLDRVDPQRVRGVSQRGAHGRAEPRQVLGVHDALWHRRLVHTLRRPIDRVSRSPARLILFSVKIVVVVIFNWVSNATLTATIISSHERSKNTRRSRKRTRETTAVTRQDGQPMARQQERRRRRRQERPAYAAWRSCAKYSRTRCATSTKTLSTRGARSICSTPTRWTRTCCGISSKSA